MVDAHFPGLLLRDNAAQIAQFTSKVANMTIGYI